MNTKQIEYIVKIAECKNFSKASSSLFISQSALNQQLLNLEKELNQKLFIRNNKELIPTKAGEIYIEYAKKIIDLKEEAYMQIKALNKENKDIINLGITKERGNQMLVSLYPEFHQKYLNMIISAKELSVNKQIELLKEGILDLGILTFKKGYLNELETIHLADEEIVIALPKISKFNLGEPYSEIDLKLLKNEPFIVINQESTLRQIQNEIFNHYNINPNIIFETESNKISYNLVKAHLGISLIPKSYTYDDDNIIFYTIKEHPKWEIAIAYNKKLTSPEKYFIELVKKYYGKIV